MTASAKKDTPETPPEPVDISDGIPDRKASMSVAVIGVLIAIFVGWCAFLLYCQYGGRV
jgi:hypothetical protein